VDIEIEINLMKRIIVEIHNMIKDLIMTTIQRVVHSIVTEVKEVNLEVVEDQLEEIEVETEEAIEKRNIGKPLMNI